MDAVNPRVAAKSNPFIILQRHGGAQDCRARGDAAQIEIDQRAGLVIIRIGKFAHGEYRARAIVAAIVNPHIFIDCR